MSNLILVLAWHLKTWNTQFRKRKTNQWMCFFSTATLEKVNGRSLYWKKPIHQKKEKERLGSEHSFPLLVENRCNLSRGKRSEERVQEKSASVMEYFRGFLFRLVVYSHSQLNPAPSWPTYSSKSWSVSYISLMCLLNSSFSVSERSDPSNSASEIDLYPLSWSWACSISWEVRVGGGKSVDDGGTWLWIWTVFFWL